jgi:hypothetical protein
LIAALGGADHKLATVTIKSSAEALAECTTTFARYFEGPMFVDDFGRAWMKPSHIMTNPELKTPNPKNFRDGGRRSHRER